MTIPVEFLQSIPYFSGLSATELDSISEFIFEKKAERGEMVLVEGEPADILYFVASGAVKVFKTSAEGKEQILNIVRPGESFNDVPIFDGGPNPAGAEAMGAVVLYSIRRILIEYAGDGTGPRPRLTQQEIAAMAGTVREVVGRSLKALEEEGAIRLEHHRIVVADMDALQGMVAAYS